MGTYQVSDTLWGQVYEHWSPQAKSLASRSRLYKAVDQSLEQGYKSMSLPSPLLWVKQTNFPSFIQIHKNLAFL